MVRVFAAAVAVGPGPPTVRPVPAPDVAAPAAGCRPRSGDLRRALLAVSVLDDLDLLPSDDAVVMPVPGAARGGQVLVLPVATATDVLGGWDPTSQQARLRLRSWLRAHRALAAAPHPAAFLREKVRALAVTHDGLWYPGAALAGAWVRARLLGGALEAGLGMVGTDESGVAVPLWPDLPAAAGLGRDEGDALWASAGEHALRMGALAARRLARDTAAPRGATRGSGGTRTLRPVGGCDVPTLLATGPVRAQVVADDPVGAVALSVPDRTRGWFGPGHVDPAFVAAAWSATEPAARGVASPLLVTADEVARP